jgi:hypothetical protein
VGCAGLLISSRVIPADNAVRHASATSGGEGNAMMRRLLPPRRIADRAGGQEHVEAFCQVVLMRALRIALWCDAGNLTADMTLADVSDEPWWKVELGVTIPPSRKTARPPETTCASRDPRPGYALLSAIREGAWKTVSRFGPEMTLAEAARACAPGIARVDRRYPWDTPRVLLWMLGDPAARCVPYPVPDMSGAREVDESDALAPFPFRLQCVPVWGINLREDLRQLWELAHRAELQPGAGVVRLYECRGCVHEGAGVLLQLLGEVLEVPFGFLRPWDRLDRDMLWGPESVADAGRKVAIDACRRGLLSLGPPDSSLPEPEGPARGEAMTLRDAVSLIFYDTRTSEALRQLAKRSSH